MYNKIGIALSSQVIIVATSKNLLRIFTLYGVQTYIFALDSVVCMSAHQEFVLIVHHIGTGYKGIIIVMIMIILFYFILYFFINY